ncbi:hypothetical protein GCM10010353_27760 [Streptomyces chryseus]|nr:hypothetical protein GCM10010353_27760 [Streptomyces chryseus]
MARQELPDAGLDIGERFRVQPEGRLLQPALDPVDPRLELTRQPGALPRHRLADEGQYTEDENDAAGQADGDGQRAGEEASQQVGRRPQYGRDHHPEEDRHRDLVELPQQGEDGVDDDADDHDAPRVRGGGPQSGGNARLVSRTAAARGARRGPSESGRRPGRTAGRWGRARTHPVPADGGRRARACVLGIRRRGHPPARTTGRTLRHAAGTEFPRRHARAAGGTRLAAPRMTAGH